MLQAQRRDLSYHEEPTYLVPHQALQLWRQLIQLQSGEIQDGNSSSSANSGLSKATSNQSTSSSRPDLTNKLGKDGKLTADECKRRLKNNLCMFCGGPGHFVDNCPKKTKKAKAHAAATDATESSKTDSNLGANSESKKE